MTTKEMLIKVKALIEQPENWKQGGLAEVKDHKAVGPFCALGSLGKAGEMFALGSGFGSRTGQGGISFHTSNREKNNGDSETFRTYTEAAKLLSECMGEDVHEYNDKRDHACVIEAFDMAIERAE